MVTVAPLDIACSANAPTLPPASIQCSSFSIVKPFFRYVFLPITSSKAFKSENPSR